MKDWQEYLKAVINSYAEIFFLEGYFPGVLLCLATFVNPNVGLAGLICVLAAYLFALFIGVHKEFLKSGFYTYNPLLVGLSIGYLFKLNYLTIFFVASAGILTFIATYSLYNVFSYYLRLPVLSLPFVLVSSLAYLAASQCSNLFVNSLYLHPLFKFLEDKVPLWLAGLTKSLGAIFFLPHVCAGLALLVILFCCSRIFFFLAMIGYFAGTLIIGLFTGSFYQAFHTINAFNFILIAMAIGGVFLIPRPKSYILALIAVAVSSLLLEAVKSFWLVYGLPVFTLPFNLISLSFVYVLGLLGCPYLTKFYRGTPERTLDYYLTYLHRFPGTERTLCLPFAGEWTVWQGMDGEWTHKGAWRYAVDFVITDEKGNTFANNGERLEDYYCFRKPILSPVRGRVVKVVNDIPDNPPGIVDKERNWGNLVLIYDERGFYILLCHLLQGSVKVKEGDWVERGKMIGLCGNSGYSPQPHLHVHVQLSPVLGAPTVPFSFVQYVTAEQVYHANHVPKKDERVTPLYPDKALDAKMTFLLDEEMEFEVFINEEKKREITLKTQMSPQGEFYFEIDHSRLYFGKWEGTFYIYRIDGRVSPEIRAIFKALPRLPLGYKEGLCWKDCLPLRVALKDIRRHVILFLSSFYPKVARIEGRYKFISPEEIRGEIKGQGTDITTFVKLHPWKGWQEIEVVEKGQKIILRRREK